MMGALPLLGLFVHGAPLTPHQPEAMVVAEKFAKVDTCDGNGVLTTPGEKQCKKCAKRNGYEGTNDKALKAMCDDLKNKKDGPIPMMTKDKTFCYHCDAPSCCPEEEPAAEEEPGTQSVGDWWCCEVRNQGNKHYVPRVVLDKGKSTEDKSEEKPGEKPWDPTEWTICIKGGVTRELWAGQGEGCKEA